MKIFFFFTITTILFSCNPGGKSNSIVFKGNEKSEIINLDTAIVKIEALNLSEDMSIVSTNNDEIFLLIYNSRDTLTLDPPVFKKSFILDTLQRGISFPITPLKNIHNNLIIFLIEEDSERTIEEIDSTLRGSHVEIANLFHKHDLKNLEKYLLDDDVLGISVLKNFKDRKDHIINLKGIIRGDQYEYRITIYE